MKTSTERILTTHTGSLPRPPGLPIAGLLDPSSSRTPSEAELRDAVAATVKAQVDAGVDVINDGEVSKPSYATYVTERLEGFGGSAPLFRPMELEEFPEWAQRLGWADPEASPLTTVACVGPVAYKGKAAVDADIANLRAATKESGAADVFMSAASPGVIAIFQPNQYYKSDEEYVGALADAMKEEYDAIHQAGFVLQLDCPDLAMGWNVARLGETPEGFQRVLAQHVEAINHATRDIPSEQLRMHLCWGNYEGPHNHDVPLADIIGGVLKARPAAISFEGANPRHEHEWTVFEQVKLPDGKKIIPGVVDSTTNYIEHPELVAQRIVRYAHLVGRENVFAGSDCGFATFAAMLTVDPKVTWAKLAAMAEGARLASRDLWA